eukprot:jgi/Ulvmu1/11105/UM070_0021.1
MWGSRSRALQLLVHSRGGAESRGRDDSEAKQRTEECGRLPQHRPSLTPWLALSYTPASAPLHAHGGARMVALRPAPLPYEPALKRLRASSPARNSRSIHSKMHTRTCTASGSCQRPAAADHEHI